MVWSQDFFNKFHKNYSFVLAGATWLEVKYMILEEFESINIFIISFKSCQAKIQPYPLHKINPLLKRSAQLFFSVDKTFVTFHFVRNS